MLLHSPGHCLAPAPIILTSIVAKNISAPTLNFCVWAIAPIACLYGAYNLVIYVYRMQYNNIHISNYIVISFYFYISIVPLYLYQEYIYYVLLLLLTACMYIHIQ